MGKLLSLFYWWAGGRNRKGSGYLLKVPQQVGSQGKFSALASHHLLDPPSVLVILSAVSPKSFTALLHITRAPVSSAFRLDWLIERPKGGRRVEVGIRSLALPLPQHCGSDNDWILLQLQLLSSASFHSGRSCHPMNTGSPCSPRALQAWAVQQLPAIAKTWHLILSS